MVRKNKVSGSNEEDMETVVKVHNNMNENTWQQVLAWEALYPSPPHPDLAPKLLRFQGRPDELSPKALLKTMLGHPKPFDRHDWIVDRGGKEVRYVIDYYSDESLTQQDQLPQHLKDIQSMKSISVDVRPALDSFHALLDRTLRMPLTRLLGATHYRPPPFLPPSPMVKAEAIKQSQLQSHWRSVQERCSAVKEALAACASENECSKLSIDLQRCVAGVVCPAIASEFDACVKSSAAGSSPQDTANIERAYEAMTKCIDTFEIDSRK